MTGTGIGFDFSQLMTQFAQLDAELKKLTASGKTFGDSMKAVFAGMTKGDFKNFAEQIKQLRGDVVAFGKVKVGLNWDSTSLQNYINDVNRLILVIKQVRDGAKGSHELKGSGISIQGLKKELKDAQELLAIVKKVEQQTKRSSYDRNTSYAGAIKYSDNVNSLEQERQAIVNLEAAKAKLKKSDADYDVKLNELNTRIQQHTENVRRASQTSAQAAEEQRKNAEKIARINATTYAGAIRSSNNATTLEQERQAVQNLEAARNKLSKTDADYQTKLDELNRRIQEHNENIRKSAMTSEQVAEEERKNADKIAKAKADAFKTPAELISMKGSANSLNELKKYAEHLQRTMATLNPKSKEWSKLNTILQQTNGKISNIENRMRSFTNESRRATSAAGGLATMIAGVFSAQQIFQYVRQLVNVTGEFEQMHIALNVITGDLEASNRIWDQTMELAKKSPFQARELVKYTRQLAAYRIETSKLHDTTKMLADVSAGLGVDMSRLILAYGQVRAAEYLRGTELRQFTEAGVPMLDELAKHFTELEGKAISTAEVFDMISKRKVAFEDVNAVLEKMTGSGGPFYRMQEQMSNTIKGSISNLKDEVDLMMYEIGTSSSGTIKGFLELLRSMVRNWEKIAAVLKVVTALYVGYNIAAIAAATSTHGFGAALTGATIKSGILAGAIGALTRAIVRMSMAFLATPFGWITLALSAIAGGIWAISNASKSAKEQEKRRAEELKQELDSINKKYEEAKNIISGITEVFSDENSSITDASVALHKLVDLAKKEYNLIFNVDVKGKTEEQIIEEGEKIATEMLAIEEDSKMLQTAWEESWSVSEVYFKRFYDGYKQVGEIAQTVGGEEFVTPIMELAILEDNKTYKSSIQDAQAKITQYYDGIKEKIKKEFTKLENQAALKMSPMAILEMYFKKKTDSGVSLDETETTVLHAISTIRSEYDKVAEEIIGATYVANNTDASISKFFNDMIEGNDFTAEQAKELQTVIEGKLGRELHVAEGSFTDWQERFNSFLSKIEDANLKGIDTEAIANLGDKYKKLIEVDGKQVRSNDLARFFEALTPGQEITEEELKKKVKEELDYWKSIKEAYENALAKGLESIHTEGDYNIAKLAVEFLDPLNTYVGNTDKGGNKGKNKAEEANKRRIDLLKKMNSQYLSEFKTFGDEAEPEIRAAYEKAFGEVFKGTKIDLEGIDFTSKTGMVEALEKLRPHAKKAGKDAVDALETEIAKFKGEIKLEARKDLFQETLDDVDELFDKYELSLEIKKLNIPPDLAKSLFGEEYLTLDELKVKTQQEFVGDVEDADKAKALTDELNKGLAGIDWNIVEAILGTDQMKELKQRLEKIDDIEDKAAKERMKTYSKYLVEGMNDRVRLKIEEMRKLKEIEESPEFNPEQKEQIKKQVSKEAREEQDKQEWEAFKGTEMYTMMFDDLEHLGTKALDALQKKLEELKGSLSDLPATEVKEIVQQISKIEDMVIEKTNPFKYMRELKKELKGMKSEEEYQVQLLDATKMQEDAQRYIDAYDTAMSALMSEEEGVFEEMDSETLATWTEMLRLAEEQGKTVKEIYDIKKDDLETGKKQASEADKGLRTHKRAKKTLEQQANAWSEYESKASEAFAVTKELMTTLGADTDGVAMSLVESSESLVMLTFQAIQFGIQMQIAGYQANMALGVIGWILIAVQAIVTLLAAIFSAKDKSLQKEIEGHLNEVEKLKEDYEELEALMEKAWSTEDIAYYNAEMKKTMNLAIEAQKAAIKAQESRKGANKEGSDAYNELQDMKKELADMENTLAESLEESFSKVTDGILDEVLDAAKDFTDAWYDAFKETGDGLSGLEENFEEMFMNLAKNQAAMQITGAFTERWKEALKDYINDEDTELTKEDAAAWAAEVRSSFPELNAALEAFLGTISEGLGGKSGNLSELQKGIQGITEETAQVLEALLNSMRLYVADTNNEIKNQTTYIKKMWTMMDNAVSGQNPFWVQMKSI